MRLACPHCAAAYEVPPSLLGHRRRLRCARCGRDWNAPGEPDDIAELVEPASSGAGETPKTRPAASTRAPDPAPRLILGLDSATALRLGWAASLLVLAISAWEAVAWRSGVMHAWPPSQRLYGTLGLEHAHHSDKISFRPDSPIAIAARPPSRAPDEARWAPYARPLKH